MTSYLDKNEKQLHEDFPGDEGTLGTSIFMDSLFKNIKHDSGLTANDLSLTALREIKKTLEQDFLDSAGRYDRYNNDFIKANIRFVLNNLRKK